MTTELQAERLLWFWTFMTFTVQQGEPTKKPRCEYSLNQNRQHLEMRSPYVWIEIAMVFWRLIVQPYVRPSASTNETSDSVIIRWVGTFTLWLLLWVLLSQPAGPATSTWCCWSTAPRASGLRTLSWSRSLSTRWTNFCSHTPFFLPLPLHLTVQ